MASPLQENEGSAPRSLRRVKRTLLTLEVIPSHSTPGILELEDIREGSV